MTNANSVCGCCDQESDYMGVVFHFYNSEDEEEDEDETSQARSEKRSRQIMEE